MGAKVNLIEQTFGRLTVIERAENSLPTKSCPSGRTRWLCLCECGKRKIVKSENLKNGHTRSCGCLSTEIGICSLDHCDNQIAGQGYCSLHYQRLLRHGDPLCSGILLLYKDKSLTRYFNDGNWNELLEAIKSFCIISKNGCWEWQRSTQSKSKDGKYGAVYINGVKSVPVHRITMMAFHQGKDPGIETVHHKYANTICCNPEHLELASHRANVAEMFERNFYIKRIKELEERLIKLEAENIVLGSALLLYDRPTISVTAPFLSEVE